MKPRTVFFFSLFDRKNSTVKASELGQFLLNLLQAFKPLAVSDLSLLLVATVMPILVVQFFDLCDLVAEADDLFKKRLDVIHSY